MSTQSNEFSKQPLTTNGWIALTLLTIIVFWSYYKWIFPQIAEKNQSMYFWRIKSDNLADDSSSDKSDSADEGIVFFDANVIVDTPKTFSEFQDNIITIHISCLSGESPCRGDLLLVGFLIDEDGLENTEEPITLERADSEEYTEVIRNIKIHYDLKIYDVQSVPIIVNVPGRFEKEVAFSIYQGENLESEILWDSPTCSQPENAQSDNEYNQICVDMDAGETFKQGVVKNLLLPPWSNTFLPFFAFAMLWLAEAVLPNKEGRLEISFLSAVYLFLLGGFFLVLTSLLLDTYLLKENIAFSIVYAILLPISVFLLARYLR